VLQNISVAFGFTYGPALYLYCASLAFQDFRISWKLCWHALPTITTFVAITWLHLPILTYAIGIAVSLGLYCLLSWRKLFEYRKALEFTRSEFGEISLSWLSRLLWISLLLLLLNILNIVFDISTVSLSPVWQDVIQFTVLLLLVNFIIFNGLQHPDLFNGVTKEETQLTHETLQGVDRLTDRQVKEIISMLDQYMNEKQSYTDPNLTIKVLSRRISLTMRDVSQAINIGKRQNFSEYVNSFRIEYAKQLLLKDHTTVLDIMFQSGFNTKSNFNRVFKKFTKTTPQEFRESHKN
jgi:AraC-like DNA-binding protein